MRLLITGGSGFIGSNLVERALAVGHEVRSVDRAEPLIGEHRPHWHGMDVTNGDALRDVLSDFRPEVVVHLAGRTDLDSDRVEDYRCNPDMLASLLAAVRDVAPSSRLIVASTMLVHPLGTYDRVGLPRQPLAGYGESKALMEEMLESVRDVPWTVIRPTTIWGPWHQRWSREFLGRIRRRAYWHPSGTCRRSYGYVGNVVEQILAMACCTPDAVVGRTLYVGDPALKLEDFVDGFYRFFHDKDAPRLPRLLLKGAGLFGDGCSRLGVRFPLTSYRLKNMTSDNVIDVSATLWLCREPPIGMEEAIRQTGRWFESQEGPITAVKAKSL